MPRTPTGCDGDTRDTTRELKSIIKYITRCSSWGSSAARVDPLGTSLPAAPVPAPGLWDMAEPSGSPSAEQSPVQGRGLCPRNDGGEER